MQSMFIANDNRGQLQRQAIAEGERRRAAIAAQGPQQSLQDRLLGLADPYAKERDQVIRDPSAALNESPFFKFMQEKYLNAATAKNAAGGFRNSGRGLMALGEAGQKASADYLFPYLRSLGSPTAGANAFLEGYKYSNPSFGGGGGSRSLSMPRQTLSSMGVPQSPAAAGGLPSGTALPYTDAQWNGSMGFGGYTPSAGAGTGYAVSDSGTTQFTPGAGGQQLSTYQPAEQFNPWEYY